MTGRDIVKGVEPMPGFRNSRRRAPLQGFAYAHPTDPTSGFGLAACLGRAVGLELLSFDSALDMMLAVSLSEVVKRGTEPDPLGLRTRLGWALMDRAASIQAAEEALPAKLTMGIAALLRGAARTMNDDQRERHLAALEALVRKIADREGRPCRAGELDVIAAHAYRSAARRVARERNA